MARPHIEPYVDVDVAYRAFKVPGFGPGMNYKMLSLDTATGGCTMNVQLDAGYKRPPGFSYSEVELLVMEGELQVGDKRCGHGYYFFIPAGKAMPAFSSKEGCTLLLMFNTGEPSFVESDNDHSDADVSLYSEVDSYNDLIWGSAGVRPSTATGCYVKLLHYHPRTEALTFLYCMTPDFYQDNISYHDCAEESYHLWGTSWMMQFGEIPTGGYFWRPAYINHGAFASKLGCLALGRTTSQLYNHFHYDPWSTAKENWERSVARLAHRNHLQYKWILMHGHNHPHGPEDFEHKGGPDIGHSHDAEPEGHKH